MQEVVQNAICAYCPGKTPFSGEQLSSAKRHLCILPRQNALFLLNKFLISYFDFKLT